MASPGFKEIKISITPELMQQIATLAERDGVSVGVMARSLWRIGVVVMLLWDAGLVVGVPVADEVAVGVDRLQFPVRVADWERMNAYAAKRNKKRSPLHREAIALGVWVCERVERIRATPHQ